MVRSTLIAASMAACTSLVATPADAGGLGGAEALETVRVASGLNRPVLATYAPGDFKRLFIIEQRGVIRVLNIKTGALNNDPFLNIDSLVTNLVFSNDERGFLGLAFHPDYQENGFFYVNYTNNSSDTVIARYQVSADPDIANLGSGSVQMLIDQPESNHNGGWIGFSPLDGNLYIATGDGGGANDQHGSTGNAQDLTNNLLGKMLRMAADPVTGALSIPADNPLVGVTGDDEIWALGLRNPWRNSFDRLTGELYIGDVGQGSREEINIQPADSIGRDNYGWRCKEGTLCTGLSGCSCSSTGLKDPVHEYSHAFGFSITGGYVYRGCRAPSLEGTYFFGDFGSGRIWTFNGGPAVDNFVERTSELSPSADGQTVNQIASFGDDAYGEVYIVDRGSTTSGQIFRIQAEAPGIDNPYTDIDCSGTVGIDDIVEVVLNWGDCDGCAADTDGDCVVGIDDIVGVVLNYGQSH